MWEKQSMELPQAQPQPAAQSPSVSRRRAIWASAAVFGLICFQLVNFKAFCSPSSHLTASNPHQVDSKAQCIQVAPILPSGGGGKLASMDGYLQSSKFRNESIQRHSGAVQIPTMSYDDLGAVGEDKRWEIFYAFEAYLKKTFPLTHATLELEKVNTHGLLYTWTGSDGSLKPTLLMAHQDVVPVPESTIPQWTYPPFSGYYDGKSIWGRGSSDDKNQLIAIMEAVELLVAAGFEPTRTLVLSFGFDEEVSGPEGAKHLAAHLLENYGKDSFSVIVDEGSGVSTVWDTPFALPGVAEKGYIDVEITVRLPGGHSSVPPDHNGIGVMSELITLIEANRYEPHLHDENPYLGLLQCGAQHSEAFPKKLKKLLAHRSHGAPSCSKKDKLALEAAKQSPMVKYLMTTSVAVDLIQGGVKVNALPERTTATVNHRVNVGDKPSDVREKMSELAGTIAKKYNLTLHAFEGEESPSSITLRSSELHELDPAPVTPTSISGSSPYRILSGTTRALYGEDVLVAPGIMTGNTDTRYYWALSKHIFRYNAGWDHDSEGGLGGIHTVDEHISVKAHISSVRWFSYFIRNMDETKVDY